MPPLCPSLVMCQVYNYPFLRIPKKLGERENARQNRRDYRHEKKTSPRPNDCRIRASLVRALTNSARKANANTVANANPSANPNANPSANAVADAIQGWRSG